MKKQYIDFVPAGKAVATTVATGKGATERKTAVGSEAKVARAARAARAATARPTTVGATRQAQAAKPAAARAKMTAANIRKTEQVSFANEGKMGVIEELNPKFVKTDVPKRPLSDKPHFKAERSEIAKIKAQKVVEKPVENYVKKSVEKPKGQGDVKGKPDTYQMPKTPFINQGKVEKRPLSKNVYAKKIAVATEEPKGPVTIISKPESQAHVGLIVTIILTIILGAAAGTVAFLLLPK